MVYEYSVYVNDISHNLNKSDNLNDFMNNCKWSSNSFTKSLSSSDLSDIWNSH